MEICKNLNDKFQFLMEKVQKKKGLKPKKATNKKKAFNKFC